VARSLLFSISMLSLVGGVLFCAGSRSDEAAADRGTRASPTGGSRTAPVGRTQGSASAPPRAAKGDAVRRPPLWAAFRGGPRRIGRTPFALPRKLPRIAWRVPTGRAVYSSPAIDGLGRIFVGSLDGDLVSVSPDGGVHLRRRLGAPVFASPALLASGDGVVVGADDDRVRLLDTETGRELWSFALGPCPKERGLGADTVRCNADASPLVGADGTIFVAADALYALRPDGHLAWRSELPAHASSSPAQGADGTIYLGTQAHTLHAVAADGKPRWVFRGGDDFDATPAVTEGGAVVAGCDDFFLYALEASSGSVRWRLRTRASVRSSAAISPGGTIVFGSDDGVLRAAQGDGRLAWSFSTKGPIRSSPTVDPTGAVVFGSGDGHLYALDAGGHLLWSFEIGADVDSSVAVGPRGRLYFGSDDGKVWALE
jgi:outer membrane protein assembly factor BamB